MRSIVTVTAAATDNALTTLTRVKSELSITVSTYDTILQQKIDEASNDIEASLGFRVSKETVSETFWHEQYDSQPDRIFLNRTPITLLSSITMDGLTVDSSLYRVDYNTGEVFALDASGYPWRWYFQKSIVAAYAGGYILPAESNSTLPKGIEGACIDLVSSFWASRGRDPQVKSEEIPGVIRTDYWVGAVGEAGELPPQVVMKLAPFRRVVV